MQNRKGTTTIMSFQILLSILISGIVFDNKNIGVTNKFPSCCYYCDAATSDIATTNIEEAEKENFVDEIEAYYYYASMPSSSPATSKLTSSTLLDSSKNKYVLSDGTTIPIIGMGVYMSEPGTVTYNSVMWALEAGYRLIDTAAYYNNEADVGKALQDYGIDRKEVYIVTKLPNEYHGYEKTMQAFEDSRSKLAVDYIDLYLIHSPIGGKLIETYDALLDLQSTGVVKSIGVSNFSIKHLQTIKDYQRPMPVINQIEMHPLNYRERIQLLRYCKNNRILIQAYGSLFYGKTEVIYSDDINNIVTDVQNDMDRKNDNNNNNNNNDRTVAITPAQLLLRWALQHNFQIIPKSTHQNRIFHNIDVFDFTIDNTQMKRLDNYRGEKLNAYWNPLDTEVDIGETNKGSLLATTTATTAASHIDTTKTNTEVYWSEPVAINNENYKDSEITQYNRIPYYYHLSDGNHIPILGLGLHMVSPGSETYNSVKLALQAGYRSIDTAYVYLNEEDVGRAIKDSGIPRDDIFVITKLSAENHGYNNTITEFMSSLKAFDIEYIDLYLIHSPIGDKIIETYDALLYIQNKLKLIKSIGVSNFNISHLQLVKEHNRPLPVVNQIEMHPLVYNDRKDLIRYCYENNILTQAYGSILYGLYLNSKTLTNIAKELNDNNNNNNNTDPVITSAMILLRWGMQHRFQIIPKSVHESRIRQNMNLFHFELTTEQMLTLDNWDGTLGIYWNPLDTQIQDIGDTTNYDKNINNEEL